MIVAKFGGTCVTPLNVGKVKRQVDGNVSAVVVSAPGKTFDGDVKVTDLLIRLHGSLPDISIFSEISAKFRRLAAACGFSGVDELLDDTLKDILRLNYYCNTVSKGEELSAKILAPYLGLAYVEAADVFIFSGGELDLEKSASAITAAYGKVGRFVTGGFYGSENGVRKTFLRGGSDVSGAVVAYALDADLYENWTDVPGFCIADPRAVPDAQTVHCIGYEDMRLLSQSGAGVLHPDSVFPAMAKGIPINVRSIYAPHDFGTIVSPAGVPGRILGVTDRKDSESYVTTVVHSLPVLSVLGKLVSALEERGATIKQLICNDNSIVVTTDLRVLDCVYRRLC